MYVFGYEGDQPNSHYNSRCHEVTIMQWNVLTIENLNDEIQVQYYISCDAIFDVMIYFVFINKVINNLKSDSIT